MRPSSRVQYNRPIQARNNPNVGEVAFSPPQAAFLAREPCRGLPVTICLQDYRDLDGRFDRILSFPNSMLPSPRQVAAALEGIFVLEDWHNFGAHYDRTLLAWFGSFARSWPRLRDKYGERFFRMWKYYLLSCAGAFRARSIQVWQAVLSPQGVPGGYRPGVTRTCSAM